MDEFRAYVVTGTTYGLSTMTVNDLLPGIHGRTRGRLVVAL